MCAPAWSNCSMDCATMLLRSSAKSSRSYKPEQMVSIRRDSHVTLSVAWVLSLHTYLLRPNPMLSREFNNDLPALAALWSGGLPPRLLSVDPAMHARLCGENVLKTNRKALAELEKRLPPGKFGPVRQSLSILLRFGDRL